jgi:hypothetical protein
MTYTRKQYLAGECSHREYYSQFVAEEVKNRVHTYIGVSRLLASTDKHLNDIPLNLWDRLGAVGSKARWDAAGDYPTAAGRVCIYKEAARQIVEENRNSLLLARPYADTLVGRGESPTEQRD